VVALASLPSFNPNRSDRAFNDLVFNRVSNQVYELGSTFKPITIAAAIDAGVVTDLSVRYPAAPCTSPGARSTTVTISVPRSTCPRR
jgi:cell division protein FtsI (penicillin-binding protein 3)